MTVHHTLRVHHHLNVTIRPVPHAAGQRAVDSGQLPCASLLFVPHTAEGLSQQVRMLLVGLLAARRYRGTLVLNPEFSPTHNYVSWSEINNATAASLRRDGVSHLIDMNHLFSLVGSRVPTVSFRSAVVSRCLREGTRCVRNGREYWRWEAAAMMMGPFGSSCEADMSSWSDSERARRCPLAPASTWTSASGTAHMAHRVANCEHRGGPLCVTGWSNHVARFLRVENAHVENLMRKFRFAPRYGHAAARVAAGSGTAVRVIAVHWRRLTHFLDLHPSLRSMTLSSVLQCASAHAMRLFPACDSKPHPASGPTAGCVLFLATDLSQDEVAKAAASSPLPLAKPLDYRRLMGDAYLGAVDHVIVDMLVARDSDLLIYTPSSRISEWAVARRLDPSLTNHSALALPMTASRDDTAAAVTKRSISITDCASSMRRPHVDARQDRQSGGVGSLNQTSRRELLKRRELLGTRTGDAVVGTQNFFFAWFGGGKNCVVDVEAMAQTYGRHVQHLVFFTQEDNNNACRKKLEVLTAQHEHWSHVLWPGKRIWTGKTASIGLWDTIVNVSLQYMQKHPHLRWIARSDADTWWNVQALETFLKTENSSQPLFIGQVYTYDPCCHALDPARYSSSFRDGGKTYVSGGGGGIMSDAFLEALQSCLRVNRVAPAGNEDTWMGKQMRQCQLRPKGSAKMFQHPGADEARLKQALDDKTVIAVHRATGDGKQRQVLGAEGMWKPMRYYEDLIGQGRVSL